MDWNTSLIIGPLVAGRLLQVASIRGQAAATLRPMALVEKIVLVTTVSVVFQQTLHGLLTNGIRTAVSIAVVVVAADFLLRWELRRFGVPLSARRELASTGAFNLFVVTVLQLFVAALRPGDRPGSALVFACVITLFVTLYDHYRPVYEVRRAEADAAATQAEEVPNRV